MTAQIADILKHNLAVRESYEHAPKRVTAANSFETNGAVLKWYALHVRAGLAFKIDTYQMRSRRTLLAHRLVDAQRPRYLVSEEDNGDRRMHALVARDHPDDGQAPSAQLRCDSIAWECFFCNFFT
jgi:hypothetical protein